MAATTGNDRDDRVRGLVLGTMHFGNRTDEATSRALMDAYVDAGGRTLDTANCYAFWQSESGAGGQSEEVIGRWLADNTGLRDDLVIATKVGVEPVVPGRFDVLEGLGAEVIARAAEQSLTRLGVDRVDLYWAHGEDRATPAAETVAALGALVSAGTVGRLGASNHPAWRVEEALAEARQQGVAGYEALQLTTSYLRPRPDADVPGKDHPFGFLSPEQLDHAVARDLELWAYSPLVQGSYDRTDRPFPEAYDHPGSTRRREVLARLADKRSVAQSQVVLAWLLHQQPMVRPIIGVSTPEQLRTALAAADIELSPEDLAALDGAN